MSGMDDHELRRFIDDPGGSALGRSLLASAQADVPSPDGRARTARRLGIVAVLAVGAGAGSEAGALAAAWKLAAVVVALGGVVGLAIWQAPASAPAPAAPPHVAVSAAPPARGSQRASDAPVAPPPIVTPPLASTSGEVQPATPAVAPQPPASPRAPSRVVAPSLYSHGAHAPAAVTSQPTSPTPGGQAVAAPAPAQEPPPAAVPEVRAPEPAASSPAAPEPVVTPAPAPATPPPAEIAAGPGRLAAEVALVDRARTSLGAGDYPAAKAALAEYHQRFTSGDLDAEAEVVTIELLIAEREIPRARTLGTAFLARFPRSPLAQRVHSLLDRLPK